MNPTSPDFSDADAAFSRFCLRHDPKDLAFVFDRVASRLLLVAAHITPDPGAAEDLVQETFVHALESAESFEAGRPVLPWLTTILRRRAVDRLRREKLRQGLPLDERGLTDDQSSPIQAAQDAEVLERVERALGEMDSPFRDALTLRIVHGLSPTEIAHTLNRKPGTVRMQLKRGLEELRAKLPMAISSVLVLAILPERGLAAVRARVLDIAAEGAKPVGFLGMKAAAWFAIACLVIAVVSLPLVWSAADPKSGGQQKPIGAAAQRSAAVNELGVAESVTRTPVDEALAASEAVSSSKFVGRCVGSDLMTPIAGAQVSVLFSAGRFVDEDAQVWPDPVTVQTAADGRFAVEFVPRREMRVALDIRASGHARTRASWVSLRSGIDIQLGDVVLPPGGEIDARVCICEVMFLPM